MEEMGKVKSCSGKMVKCFESNTKERVKVGSPTRKRGNVLESDTEERQNL